MSRSGYSDECNGWSLICYRGAVKSAMRGSRGQKFFASLIEALDKLPEKKLIKDSFDNSQGGFCTLGALGHDRELDMSGLNSEENEKAIAKAFNIAPALASETMFENDGDFNYWGNETEENRFIRMRAWAVAGLEGKL